MRVSSVSHPIVFAASVDVAVSRITHRAKVRGDACRKPLSLCFLFGTCCHPLFQRVSLSPASNSWDGVFVFWFARGVSLSPAKFPDCFGDSQPCDIRAT
jgi:hypothetical protein